MAPSGAGPRRSDSAIAGVRSEEGGRSCSLRNGCRNSDSRLQVWRSVGRRLTPTRKRGPPEQMVALSIGGWRDDTSYSSCSCPSALVRARGAPGPRRRPRLPHPRAQTSNGRVTAGHGDFLKAFHSRPRGTPSEDTSSRPTTQGPIHWSLESRTSSAPAGSPRWAT
jgi:hypothetical protein